MAMSSPTLHWFFIDFTNKRKRYTSMGLLISICCEHFKWWKFSTWI